MKKRLMSAFLALAMVLTLLPSAMVPASAATIASATATLPTAVVKSVDAQGVSHYFAEATANDGYTTVTVTYQKESDNPTGRVAGRWYWTDNVNKDGNGDYTYYYVTSGIVAGTGTSGLWYPDFDAFTKADESLRGTSFTMLADVTIPSTVLSDSNTKAPTTLTIDVNGNNLTLPSTLPSKFSNLTITNRLNPLTNSGSVSAIAKDTSSRTSPAPAGISYANLTVSIKDTTVAGIDIKGGANTVTLNNVNVTGAVSMNGKSTTTASNGTVSYAYGNQTLNVNNDGVNNLSTSTSLGGAVTISEAASATVNLNNATGGSAVTVNANGGSVNVNGLSTLGAVTVGTRAGDYAPPALTINGGSVGAITRSDGDTSSTKTNNVTINSAGTAASVEMGNATVKVDRGAVTGDLTVRSGSLTIAGPATIGGETILTGKGKTTLSISGTGSKMGDITAADGGNLTISAWPTGRQNTFGKLDLSSAYKARGVKGGTFTDDTGLDDSANAYWFDTSLQYVVEMPDSTYGLYGKTELATAISDISSKVAGAAAEMHILCQQDTYTLNLQNGGLTWAKIGYEQPTGMILPTMINGYSISTWTSDDNSASVTSGVEKVIPKPVSPATDFTLYANGVATTVVKSITQATVSGSTVENQDVRVTMSGTNIQISGAITPAPGSNIATIMLDLTTDALQTTNADNTAGGGATPGSTGYLVLHDVQVFYNVDTKAVQFSDLQKLDGGAIVNDKGELVLNNGTGTHYTVSASLVQSASSLLIYKDGKEVQATVGGSLASRTQTDKDNIIKQVAGTGAEFDINGNRAILEAINAAQATVTSDSTVSGWVTTAQNYVWKNGNKYTNATTGQPNGLGKGDGSINPHTGNLTTTGAFAADAAAITSKYTNAYIVPYLVINVTDMSQTGTMTATMTVYYRVDVSASTYSPTEYYTVKTGTPLSALTGDMFTYPVQVKLATAFPYSTATWMHQDGKYAYQADSGVWSITHAGSGNGSLGTIVLNATPGPITLTSDIASRAPALPAGTPATAYYDDLQAAIDDTVPGIVTSTGDNSTETMDTITIGGAYAPTECVINMTGVARKVKVVSNGNRKITKGNSNVDVQTLDGYNFIVQLKQDTAAAGTNIIVANATGGSASVSTKLATVGQTVTITLSPNTGYSASGVTVKDSNGNSVSVSGSGNSYSFTMPSASSVTVTPSFTATQTTTTATVTVRTPSTGSGAAATDVGSRAVAPGTTVMVTTSPSSGQRTMGLTVTGTTAVRTGTNTFQFTVPSGYTNVTVTPSFDVNNGTVFADVWSTEYFSKAVAWAVGAGITTGTSTYAFSPYNSCTRADMVTFLWRAAGSPTVTNVSNPFWDVVPGQYYYNAVLWAYSKGITNGVSANQFGVSQAVTRAQAVTFLYRYEGSPAASSYSGFYDVPTSEYYAKAVAWANAKGVTNGTSTTAFSPNSYCLRGQIVTFLYRDKTGDIT